MSTWHSHFPRYNLLTCHRRIARHHSRTIVHERPEPWPHTTTQVTHSRRREDTARCPQTTTSTKKMAAWHGHVHPGQCSREHGSDIDATASSPFDITSLRSGVQLDMRDANTRRALHKVVAMGNAARLQRRDVDCDIWRYSVAFAQTQRAAGAPRSGAVFGVDVVAGRAGRGDGARD